VPCAQNFRMWPLSAFFGEGPVGTVIVGHGGVDSMYEKGDYLRSLET